MNNPEEVTKIIQGMELKMNGFDVINAKVLKELADVIVDPIVHIINLCIGTVIWPDSLKCAEINPIFKEDDKSLPNSYRTISLISNLAKIPIIKKIGTKDALCKIISLLTEKIDETNPVSITFLDLAEAFDTVNHNILLKKLNKYGIRGHTSRLLRSYSSNRKQRVKNKDFLSEFQTVTTGERQGTILGPLLFILYVNDLLTLFP